MESNEKPTTDISDSMREAQRVDALADRAPTTEQSARENAGWTRRPPDGHPDPFLGVSDTDRTAPLHTVEDEHGHHDSTHRMDHDLQGEDVAVTGKGTSERRPNDTHL